MKNKEKLKKRIEQTEKELAKLKEELNKPEIGIESWDELNKEAYISKYYSMKNGFYLNLTSEIIALQKLIYLRDSKYYNDGWMPDWEDNTYIKYTIYSYKGKVYKSIENEIFKYLSFKTEEIRDVFYDNHLDLIKQAFPTNTKKE